MKKFSLSIFIIMFSLVLVSCSTIGGGTGGKNKTPEELALDNIKQYEFYEIDYSNQPEVYSTGKKISYSDLKNRSETENLMLTHMGVDFDFKKGQDFQKVSFEIYSPENLRFVFKLITSDQFEERDEPHTTDVIEMQAGEKTIIDFENILVSKRAGNGFLGFRLRIDIVNEEGKKIPVKEFARLSLGDKQNGSQLEGTGKKYGVSVLDFNILI